MRLGVSEYGNAKCLDDFEYSLLQVSGASANPVSFGAGSAAGKEIEKQLPILAHEETHQNLMSSSVFGFIQGEIWYRIYAEDKFRKNEELSPEKTEYVSELKKLFSYSLKHSMVVHESIAHYVELCEARRLGSGNDYQDTIAKRGELYDIPLLDICGLLDEYFAPIVESQHLKARLAKVIAIYCMNSQAILKGTEERHGHDIPKYFHLFMAQISSPKDDPDLPDYLFVKMLQTLVADKQTTGIFSKLLTSHFKKQALTLFSPNYTFSSRISADDVPISISGQRFSSFDKRKTYKQSILVRKKGKHFDVAAYKTIHELYGNVRMATTPMNARSYIYSEIIKSLHPIDGLLMPRWIDQFSIWGNSQDKK